MDGIVEKRDEKDIEVIIEDMTKQEKMWLVIFAKNVLNNEVIIELPPTERLKKYIQQNYRGGI